MKKVTIVIPNYNGCHFLEGCMEALRAQTCQDFEVLLVDNASSDGSVAYLEAHYPEVRVDVMERNLGFSGGVNYGIMHSETPYVILLNNDTEVDPDYVKEMIRAIEKSPKIFSVSSRMVQFHHRELMDDAGDMFCMMGWSMQRGIGRTIAAYEKPCRVFSACAGAAIYRREVFEEIGLFDEMHFAYLEDIDVGYRANIAGYINTYAPKAIVYHVGSGTTGSKYNPFKVKLTARNSVYLLYKNMPIPQLVWNLPTVTVGYMVKFIFFVCLGYGKDYAAGFWEGIKTHKKCQKVPYERKNLGNYVDIQMQMYYWMITYVKEFCGRHFV